MNTTYYEILGVPQNAPLIDIQKAYIQKNNTLTSINDKRELMQMYNIIANPITRQQYDMQLNMNQISLNNKPNIFTTINQSLMMFDQIFQGVEQIMSRIDPNQIQVHVVNMSNTPEFQQFANHVMTDILQVPSQNKPKSSVIVEEIDDDIPKHDVVIPKKEQKQLLLELPSNNDKWKINKDNDGCVIGMINDDVLDGLIKK